MQASQARDTAAPARQQRRGAAAPADGRAEFREMFVSLVDPAGMLDMEKCAETAAQMGRAARESGYGAGAAMSSVMADIFADVDDVAGRPVEDGVLCLTYNASYWMMGVLRDTAEAYRGGGDDEPVGRLEEVRERIAGIRSEADRVQEEVRGADPPGSGLLPIDECHRDKICRDVIREEQEEFRAQKRAQGHDPIFPPKPRTLTEVLGDKYNPDMTSVDMMDISKGSCPEGYELVKIPGHERWSRKDNDCVS